MFGSFTLGTRKDAGQMKRHIVVSFDEYETDSQNSHLEAKGDGEIGLFPVPLVSF